jgi:hypothetical protein
MRIGGFEFEGTPAELLSIKQSLEAKENTINTSKNDKNSAAMTDGSVSVDVAKRVMTRIKLNDSQRLVLLVLRDNTPNWVLATDLQKLLNYSPSEFAGLMGAFGRRVTHTDGFVYGAHFFEQEWNLDHMCNQYRLPDSVMEAMVQAGID